MQVLEREVAKLKGQLDCIKKVATLLSDSKAGLREKMNSSLLIMLDQIRANQGSILIFDKNKDSFKICASTKRELIDKFTKIKKGSVSGYVCETKSPLLIKDINKDKRFRQVKSRGYKTSSCIAVPLLSTNLNELLGIITASDRADENEFAQEDLELMIGFSTWLTPLLEISFLNEELKGEKNRYQKLFDVLKVKQRELIQTTKERSELVEMVVHDFKSPLSAVISNLELLNYLGLDEQKKEIVDTAFRGAKNLLSMIDEFLQLAKFDSWKDKNVELGEVDLLEIIQDVLNESKSMALEKNIKLAQDIPFDSLPVIGDYSMLRHLVQNIFSNAFKYTPAKGRVEVIVSKKKSQRSTDVFPYLTQVCIQDSGIGVPGELKKDIFEKFQRSGDKNIDKKIEGTGIGLYISNKIVRLHNGKIWVEDAKPKGSKFCFQIYSPR